MSDTVAGTGLYDKQALDYSGTNVQVAGVDEADLVKTDGNFIYQVNKQNIKIIRACGFRASGGINHKF